MLRSSTFPRGVSTLHTDASGTAPPDAFGPFRVLHQIGVGVLGPVFRAYQPDPGRLVAVKQFRLDLPPESAHRFVAALDALIAADLTHLGIAAPLAAGLVENSPYLAMDFAAAESFDVVVRDYGPAPVSEALRIATQLGGALDFAAAVNVFHGSLHPRDVLVSTDDTRVTGLGIAHALELVGLLPPIRRPYTAPERVAGLAWDRRADTFSLAALVYEMLFGRRIAGVGSDAAEAIPSSEGLDVHAMRTLFARALAEDPGERFETALSFADALHNAVAQPAAGSTPKSSRARRKPPGENTRASVRETPPALPLELGDDLPLTRAADAMALELGPAESVRAPQDEAPEEERQLDSTLPDERLPEPMPIAIEEPIAEEAASAEPVDEPIVGAGETLAFSEEPDFDEVELRRAEEERYALVDDGLPASPETLAETEAPVDEPVVPQPIVRPPDLPPSPPPVSPSTFSSMALEESRSAIWPIALALTVGLLVGFAFGYGAGTRGRVGNVAQNAALEPDSTPPPAAPDAPSVPPPRASAPAQTAPPPGAQPAAPSPSAGSQRSVPERPAPAPAPDRGRLLVRSTPAGARVSIDGRDAGATPLTLDDVAFGTHVVRISRQGYVAAERRVRIRSAQPAQSIEVELAATRPARGAAPAPAVPERSSGPPAAAPSAAAGSLMVDSRPTGARVFVDDRLVGTTPLLLDTVAAGEHAVRLEIDGFNTWSTTTRVVGGQRNRVSGSLEQR